MITVKHLTKRYGPVTAVKDISFDIKKGEIVGLLGPNGAGKTTTMRILTCFMGANTGEAKIAGHDVFTDPLEVRKKIGYLPEHAPLYEDMNVKEYLEYIASMHGISGVETEEKTNEVIKTCGLESKLYSEINELSKGYKQRVGLAQALIHNPPILILDEPTSGLDPNQIVEIRHLIKKISQEKTIILSTHILSEVEATCDRVLIIHEGIIVASGTVDELKKSATHKNHLHLKVEGTEPKAIEIIKNIEHVDGVEKIHSEEHKTQSFKIVSGRDVRKIVIHSLQKNGFEPLEIWKEDISLENVFAKLTMKK